MTKPSTLTQLSLKRDRLLKMIGKTTPFIDGSIYKLARTCGNPRCKCAQGDKHVSPYLSYKLPVSRPGEKPQSKTLYIPVDLQKDVAQWVQEYAKLKYLIKEINQTSKQIIRTHVTAKGRHRKRG